MPPPTLDYRHPSHDARLNPFLGLFIFAFGIIALTFTIRHILFPPPAKLPPILVATNQYISQSQAIIDNTQLTDIQRARQLFPIIDSARKTGLLPFRFAASPTAGEIELGVLLSDPSLQSAIGPDKSHEFLNWLQSTYPQFKLEYEIWLRHRTATTRASR